MFTGNSRERLVQDCCYGYLINVHEIATMLQLEENVIDLIYVYWKLKRKVGTRLLLRLSDKYTQDSHCVTIIMPSMFTVVSWLPVPLV